MALVDHVDALLLPSTMSSSVELLDRYQIPATWAIVAAVLDKASAAEQPGDQRCWYAYPT